MTDMTLICSVPYKDGVIHDYYSIPAKGGESVIRWGGLAPITAWKDHPRLRGLAQWASRKAGRQVDVNRCGSVLLQEPG